MDSLVRREELPPPLSVSDYLGRLNQENETLGAPTSLGL